MNTITSRAAALNTIHAMVLMNDGSRIERTIGYDPRNHHSWRTAMLQVGAGLVHAIDPDAISSLVTITTNEHGTDVSHYAAPTEAAEILGYLD